MNLFDKNEATYHKNQISYKKATSDFVLVWFIKIINLNFVTRPFVNFFNRGIIEKFVNAGIKLVFSIYDSENNLIYVGFGNEIIIIIERLASASYLLVIYQPSILIINTKC